MRKIPYRRLLPVYTLVLACLLLVTVGGSKAVTAWSAISPVTGRRTVIIDAGHGGVDGGATSCSGILESQLNLEIVQRLNDLMHLLGMQTRMIRETDCSIYTQGETIAQKKISDLRERVRIVNNTQGCVLISIHQNHFPNSKYSGAQVFYAQTTGSRELSTSLQENLKKVLNPDSTRQIKKADGIYLMQHINCPAALIECGFLSNPREEQLLRTQAYQQRLCCVIACTVSTWLWDT